jgi:hypothetical protein
LQFVDDFLAAVAFRIYADVLVKLIDPFTLPRFVLFRPSLFAYCAMPLNVTP